MSFDIGSPRQASRTWRSAALRSPRASSARASMKRPLADSGCSPANQLMTALSSRLLSHSADSPRRRRKLTLGQPGLRGDEGAVAFGRGAVALAAQDHPLGDLLRDRILNLLLHLRRIGALPVRAELDGALERVGVCLRGGRLTLRSRPERAGAWRRADAAAAAAAPPSAPAPSMAARTKRTARPEAAGASACGGPALATTVATPASVAAGRARGSGTLPDFADATFGGLAGPLLADAGLLDAVLFDASFGFAAGFFASACLVTPAWPAVGFAAGAGFADVCLADVLASSRCLLRRRRLCCRCRRCLFGGCPAWPLQTWPLRIWRLQAWPIARSMEVQSAARPAATRQGSTVDR